MSAMTPNPWVPRFAAVRAVVAETPGVQTYDLAFADGPPYTFRPGQFNMLYLPGIGEAAISVSSDPAVPSILRHTVRAVGNVTRAMTRLKTGDALGVRGPFGTAWPLEKYYAKDVVLVAGGIGLAPLRPAVYELVRRRRDFGRVTLIYGDRTPADRLYTAEYDAWKASGIDVIETVNVGTPEWRGAIGVVTAPLAALPLDPARTGLFTCGPEVMMRFAATAAVGRGVAESDIWVSLERNMNCAVGLCGHCQFGSEFVCKDGPIFPYDRVRRLLFVENF